MTAIIGAYYHLLLHFILYAKIYGYEEYRSSFMLLDGTVRVLANQSQY